jgi:hypothetical protein
MASSVTLKLPCGGEEHRLRIHRDGTIEMLNHDADMVVAFTAFGAERPECLLAAEEWRDAWPGPDGLSVPVQLGRAMLFMERFLTPMQIRLVATDWATHVLPIYERVKTRGKIATLPRRMIKAVRAQIRKGHVLLPGERKRTSPVVRALAPLRAEMLQGERYIEEQRWVARGNEAWNNSPEHLRYIAISRALEAASHCYYLVIPLGGWYLKPPPRAETLEAAIGLAMKAQEARGATRSTGVTANRKARHGEQRWQLWHAARVIAAVQGGKSWPRIS